MPDLTKLDQVDRDNIANWERIPQMVRDDCLRHLARNIAPENIGYMREQIRQTGRITIDHFFFGMGVRNVLRDQYTDEELPPVKYPNGQEARNWDDFYMGALYALAEK